MTTSLFPAGLCVNLDSSDAKEMEEQFSKGQFRGKLVVVHTRQLQLIFSSRSTGVIFRGDSFLFNNSGAAGFHGAFGVLQGTSVEGA